jgi:hypothetical protein
MSDWFIDHENTTLYPSAYMSTPASSASLPQEGDGKAYGGGATPAVSSASWNLTSASCAGAGVMTCMGATVSSTLTGSGATLATNIANAINASTAAATTATGGITSPYLKALVWATTSGATLTVYSRIASVDLNYANNNSCVLAAGTGWTSPPANAQFSGGVSGPWRYFFNTTALTAAPSSGVGTTVGGYGAWPGAMMGTPAAGDVIHIRTKRSGSNITLTLPSGSGISAIGRAIGTRTAPLIWLADNGIKWSGDAGVWTMTTNGSQTVGSRSLAFNGAANSQILSGVYLTETTRNWKFEVTGTYSTYSWSIGGHGSTADCRHVFDNIEFSQTSYPNAGYSYLNLMGSFQNPSGTPIPCLTLRNCVIKNSSRFSPIFCRDTYRTWTHLENCLFDANGLTQATDYALVSGGSSSYLFRLTANGCEWRNYPAAANQTGFQVFTASQDATAILRDCSLTNIKVSGMFVGSSESSSFDGDYMRAFYLSSALGVRPFVDENSLRSFAWFDSAQPKTVASTLPDGTTPFSVRTAVTTESGKVGKQFPVYFPRLGKLNSLADGSRTAKLRLLVDNNIKTALGSRDPKNDEMFVNVYYVGTDGLPKFVTTRCAYAAAPNSLSAGTAGDWSATSYDIGVVHNYSPFEISASLPSVKSGTELGLVFAMGVQSSSVDNFVILDPEWSLT